MAQPYHHGALRKALLDAAETILERDGIVALTLRATAREAGVSHAAPTHHFGDLTGLLTELVASGFVRFRAHLQAEAADAEPDLKSRVIALGRGYVRFARTFPGLFLLMFRSERLDWSSPALIQAGAAAFGLMNQPDPHSQPATEIAFQGYPDLVATMARWSSIHGLSMLIIDGRFQSVSEKMPGVDLEALIEQVLIAFV